jgi:hypothetical protein
MLGFKSYFRETKLQNFCIFGVKMMLFCAENKSLRLFL